MIEIDINKIVSWKTIEHIKNLAKKDVVIVRMPKSVYNHKKMKYKIEILKGIPTVVINIEEKQKGRKRIIDNNIKEKIAELIKENYSIREIADVLSLKKSTVWNYAKEHIKELKKEYLKNLIWEYKEKLIEADLWDYHIEMMFLELEMYIKNDNLDKAKETLTQIISYTKEGEDD